MAIPYSAIKAARKAQTETQPEEESTLSKIAGYALSPVAAVGNALDLLPSMGRDILAGENPFDQWLHPLSDIDRTSGRELGQKWGLWGENDPNKWEAADFGGFGLEVALDPFTWLTPFGLTKLGTQSAKAGKTAGKSLKAGIQSGERGLIGARIPFTDISTAVGSGKAAQKVAEYFDKTGEALAYGNVPGTKYSPGRHLSQMFDTGVMGKESTVAQKAARGASRAIEKEQAEVAARSIGLAKRGKELTEDVLRQQRDQLEGLSDITDESVMLGMKANRDNLEMNRLAGLRANELDDVIEHFPRQASIKGQPASNRAAPFSAHRSYNKAREDWTKGFKGGTNRFNEIVTDQGIKDAIAEIAEQGGKKRDIIAGVRNYIESQFGSEIVPDYHLKGADGRFKMVSAEGKQLSKSRKELGRGELVDAAGTPFEGQFEKVWHFKDAKSADTKYLAPVMADRYDLIAKNLVKNPQIMDEGLFHNDWQVDLHERLMSDVERRNLANASYDILRQRMGSPGRNKISQIFDQLGIDRDGGVDAFLRRSGVDVDQLKQNTKTYSSLKNTLLKSTIDDATTEELLSLWPAFRVPKEIGTIQKGVASLNNLFKAGVLTWPARYVRDVTSGQAQNMFTGLVKPWELMTHGADAHRILQGRAGKHAVEVLQGAMHHPEVQKIVQESGLNAADPGGATEIIKILYDAYGPKGNIQTDIAGEVSGIIPKTVDDLLENQVGRARGTVAQSVKDVAKTAVGIGPDGFKKGNLNPLSIRGFAGKAESTFGPVAAGNRVGKYTDDMNRLTPFMAQLKRGFSPSEAMRKVNAAQVNYNPKTFTATEKQLKLLFPFYSFTSRQLPYLVKTLATDPGGGIGKAIRASRLSSDPTAPDYVSSRMAIPLGQAEDGTKRYITGLGFMHEDPLSFFDGTVRGGLGELISRSTPLIKAPLEWASGESFFQRGPLGGRELEDMDPIIGRTVSNITGEKAPFTFPGSKPIEFIAANSPISRGLTTVRQLTDPRKGTLAKTANALTGMRISDVSPQSEKAVLRERTQAAWADLGAKDYTRYWMPDEAFESLSPEMQQNAMVYEAIIKGLDRDSKRRKKEKGNKR